MRRLYKVTAAYLYGEDREAKRAAQLQLLSELGLQESCPDSGTVYCDADAALELRARGYCEPYSNTAIEAVHELPSTDAQMQDLLAKVNNIVDRSAQFNQRLGLEQPGLTLQTVTHLMLASDACTDLVQEYLSRGWRILAIQPQPDQRRPDYILGRTADPLPTSAARAGE